MLVSVDDFCYESLPCKHECTFDDGRVLLLSGPDIVREIARTMRVCAPHTFRARTVRHLLQAYNTFEPDMHVVRDWIENEKRRAQANLGGVCCKTVHMAPFGESDRKAVITHAIHKALKSTPAVRTHVVMDTETGKPMGGCVAMPGATLVQLHKLYFRSLDTTPVCVHQCASLVLNGVAVGTWVLAALGPKCSVALGVTMLPDTPVEVRFSNPRSPTLFRGFAMLENVVEFDPATRARIADEVAREGFSSLPRGVIKTHTTEVPGPNDCIADIYVIGTPHVLARTDACLVARGVPTWHDAHRVPLCMLKPRHPQVSTLELDMNGTDIVSSIGNGLALRGGTVALENAPDATLVYSVTRTISEA